MSASPIRLTDDEFAALINAATNLEGAAEMAGLSQNGLYGRIREFRKKYPNRPLKHLGAPKKKPKGDGAASKAVAAPAPVRGSKRALPRGPVRAVAVANPDPEVAYCAAVLDTCGTIDVRPANGRPARMVLRLGSAMREVIGRVHARFGGVMEEIIGPPHVYSLTWSTEEECLDFLFHMQPYSARWKNEIEPVVAWLEVVVEAKWREQEVMAILHPPVTDLVKIGNGTGQ